MTRYARASASSRGYDRQWQKVRAQVLVEQPLCRHCELAGKVQATEQVHHVKPIATHPELRLDRANLLGLCGPCHSAETGREKVGKTGLPGCDVAGRPIDPEHPWNARPA